MMLTIGICDDEITQLNYLKEKIAVWGNMTGIFTSVREFSSAESFCSSGLKINLVIFYC